MQLFGARGEMQKQGLAGIDGRRRGREPDPIGADGRDLQGGVGGPALVKAVLERDVAQEHRAFQGDVAVGDATGHTDVEDFGRGFSDGQIAQEATSILEAKLEEHGLITAVGRPNKSLERTRES